MRTTMLLLSAMVLTLLVASGVALAASRTGDDGPNNIVAQTVPTYVWQASTLELGLEEPVDYVLGIEGSTLAGGG